MLLYKIIQAINVAFKVISVILIICVVAGYVILKVNWRIYYTDTETALYQAIPTSTPQPTVAPTQIIIQSNIKPLTDNTIIVSTTDNVSDAFVNYFDKTMNLVETNWTGNGTDPLTLSLSNYSSIDLKSYSNWVDQYTNTTTIPNSLDNIYNSTTAKTGVISIIQSAESDFIKYLTAVGINSNYINEIQGNTLVNIPANIQLIQNTGSTYIESHADYVKDTSGNVINNDYSKLNLIVYANDIYNKAVMLKNSGIIPSNAYSNTGDLDVIARDMATRYTTYRLMTTVLQRAVDTVNAPDKYKTSIDSYLEALKSLSQVNLNFTLSWGGVVYNQVNNQALTLRRQDDFVGIDVLSSAYALSQAQKNVLEYKLFGKYQPLAQTLVADVTNFNNKYPQFPILSMKQKILADFISLIDFKNIYKPDLISINNQISLLPQIVADYSYYNIKEKNTFWDYLK